MLDLKAAAPLAEELLSLVGIDVRVDASAVQRLGAQCLQVLLAARRKWQVDKVAFEVTAPSKAMRDATLLLGAMELLFGQVEAQP